MGLFLQPARGEAASRDRTLASALGSREFWLITATYVILGSIASVGLAVGCVWLAAPHRIALQRFVQTR